MKFKQFPGLTYLFSTCYDHNMSFRHGEIEEVQQKRAKFLKRADLELENCTAMRVEFNEKIVEVSEKDKEKGMQIIDDAIVCDSLITQQIEHGLFLVIADCLPVIIFDPKQKALGLAHCGWKNTDLRLSFKMMRRMIEEYGSDPADCYAIIGPGAQKESFTYDKNFLEKTTDEWAPFISHNPETDLYHIDNAGLNVKQLRDAGLQEEHIYDCGIDTVIDPMYYSHYKFYHDGNTEEKRFAVVAKINR
jgi:copper oxidase (laccase) domain-containing protein